MKKIWDILLKYYNKYNEVVNYIIFGILTTIVNYIIYVICAKGIKIDIVISTAIAWLLSVLFAYLTNRWYVFKSKAIKKTDIILELLSFFWFRIVSGVLDVVIMYISVDLMEINDLIMKLVSNFIVVILNYIFSKLFIFNNRGDNVKKEKREL